MTSELQEHNPPPTAEAEAPFHTSGVVTAAGAHALHDTYTAFLPALLPKFIETLSLTRTEAGLLTVFVQALSLLQPAIGHLADRVDLRWLIFVAPAVTTSLMSLVAVAPSYGAIALILSVVGLSSAGLHAVVPAFAGRLSGAKLGRGMSFWMVGGEIGRTLGPIIVVAVIGVAGLGGMPWLIIPGVAGAAIIMVLYGRTKGSDHTEAISSAAWWQAIGKMKAVMAPLVALVFLRAFMAVAVTTYLPTFLTDEGAELWLAGISLAVLEAAGVAGAFAGGSLSDRLGRKMVLALSLVLSPMALLGFLAVTGLWQMPFLLALGFVLLSTTPVIMALVQESYPENRTLANGMYMALSFVLRSIVVVIVGQIGDAYGLRTALTLSAVLMLVALPLLWFLPESKGAKA